MGSFVLDGDGLQNVLRFWKLWCISCSLRVARVGQCVCTWRQGFRLADTCIGKNVFVGGQSVASIGNKYCV